MSKLIEGTARGAIWHTVSQVALTVAGYVVAVIIARALGPADFGTYGVIYSFLVTLELTMVLGIPPAVTRLIADGYDEDGEISATGLSLVLALSAVAFAVMWLMAPLLAMWLGVPGSAHLFRIAALDIPLFGLFFLISHTLNGRRDFAGQSIATLLSAGTRVAGTAGLAAFGLTVAGAFVMNIVASIVRVLFVMWRGDRRLFALRLTAVRPILSLAVSISAITVGTQLALNLDLWFLSNMSATVGQDVIGHYVAAKNIARLPNFMAFVLNAVLIPSIAHAVASGDNDSAGRIIRGAMRFLAVTLVPATCFLVVDAGPTMAWLFSPEYATAGSFLQLLLLANGLLHTLFSTLVTILVATRHQRWGSAVALVGLVPALLLSVLLIPRFGATGAAASAIASAAITCGLAAAVARKYVNSLTDSWLIPKTIAATLLVCAVSIFIPASGTLLVGKWVLMALLFLLVAFALRLVRRDDLAVLRRR